MNTSRLPFVQKSRLTAPCRPWTVFLWTRLDLPVPYFFLYFFFAMSSIEFVNIRFQIHKVDHVILSLLSSIIFIAPSIQLHLLPLQSS